MSDPPNPALPGRRAPAWLKLMNLINRPLLRRGIGPAPQHLLSLRGRNSGIPRATPVAVLEFRGDRFVVAGYSGADWVKNARLAGSAELRRGREHQRVLLEEVPVSQRPPILREFALKVRGGRSFMTFRADSSDQELAQSSPEHPIFRLRVDPGEGPTTAVSG
ncbi:MAG: nitroreductase/quinone reductase family protein [Candidatus Dormiibacterota bacterium]